MPNLSPTRPGDDYDRRHARAYQRRLLESRLLRQRADRRRPGCRARGRGPGARRADRGQPQHVEAGLGYSTDAGPRLELRYSNQDLFDSAWRFKSGLRLDRRSRSCELNLDSPPRSDARWNSVFARAGSRPTSRTSRPRARSPSASRTTGLRATPSALIVSAHIEEQIVGGRRQPTTRHALYFGFRRTSADTDDLVSPRSGYLAQLRSLAARPRRLARAVRARDGERPSLFHPVGRDDDLLLRGQPARCAPSRARASRRRSCSAPAATRRCAATPSRAWACRRATRSSAGAASRSASVGIHPLVRRELGPRGLRRRRQRLGPRTRLHAAIGYGVGARFRTPIGPIRADLAYGEDNHRSACTFRSASLLR